MNSNEFYRQSRTAKFNDTTIWLYCFCLATLSSAFWPSLPTIETLGCCLVLLVTVNALVLCHTKLGALLGNSTAFYGAISSITFGIMLGVIWAASVGHLHYAWQLPEDKIQQDVMIVGKVLNGGCAVSSNLLNNANSYQGKHRVQETKRYTVELATLDNISAAYYTPMPSLFSLWYSINPPKLTLSYKSSWRKPSNLNESMSVPDADECLHNGDTFHATVKLKPAYGTANPIGFNKQQHLVSQGVVAAGYIKHIYLTKTLHQHKQRSAYKQTLASLQLQNQKWWQALLFGDRSALNEQDWQLLQLTGTGHLFSISGMHLSIVASTVFIASSGLVILLAFLNKFSHFVLGIHSKATLTRSLHLTPLRVCVFLFVLLLCWFYASLSGLALPVVRAYILLVIACFIVCMHFVMRPLHIIALMCVGGLLVFPLSHLTASFYLSVGAVVVITLISLRFKLHQKPWYVALFQLQVCISVTIIPLTLVWFGSASMLSLVANLLALPLITVLLPVSLLLLFLLHFSQLHWSQPPTSQQVIHQVAPNNELDGFVGLLKEAFEQVDTVLTWFFDFLHALAAFDLFGLSDATSSSVHNSIDMPLSAPAAISSLAALCLLFFPYFRGKYFFSAILIAPFILAFLPNSKNVWQVHVFDAGQASAIAVTQGTSAIIIDSGLSVNGHATTAKRVMIPFLRGLHIERIAHVIHTHGDNDHAGGASTIINSPLASGSINYTPLNGCEHGKTVEWEQLRILFLWPKAGNQEDSNAQSCVVKITDGEQSVLIPGDIERSSEYALLTLLKQTNKHNSYKHDLEADLLIAPHHGSKTSSTNAFIRAVNPKAVVFTQGYLNRWKFPAKEVQERYRNNRVLQLKTSYHGYIKATFLFNHHSDVTTAEQDSFRLESYRKDLHKRWFIPAR